MAVWPAPCGGTSGPTARPRSVPIGHVTNGVHLPTWMAPSMRRLLARYLGPDFEQHADDPEHWERVEAIPDEELWAVRSELRALARPLREGQERRGSALARRDQPPVRRGGGAGLRPRRAHDRLRAPHRGLQAAPPPVAATRPARSGCSRARTPVQVVIAGKAHPQDHEAKALLQQVFSFKEEAGVAHRVAFLEDYDLRMAAQLVRGLRRLAEPPAPAARGQRHQRHEGGAERRPPPERPRRLVGGGVRRAGAAGRSRASRRTTPDAQDDRDAEALYDLLETRGRPALLRSRRGRRAARLARGASARRCARSGRASTRSACCPTTSRAPTTRSGEARREADHRPCGGLQPASPARRARS